MASRVNFKQLENRGYSPNKPWFYISGNLTLDPRKAKHLKKFYEKIAKTIERNGGFAYLPHTVTDPVVHRDIPASDVYDTDVEAISCAKDNGAVIAYVGKESHGVGMEVQEANRQKIPTILLYEKYKTGISRLVSNFLDTKIGKFINRFLGIKPREKEVSSLLLGGPSIKAVIKFDGYDDALRELDREIKGFYEKKIIKTIDESSVYLYWQGLTKLAKNLKGTETFHMGIRPFGFHGGNKLTLVVYPLLLCEEFSKLGKTPRFKFYLSINDWEPHRLSYIDPDRLQFNISPEQTTFQYTPDPAGCCKSIVDHWEKIIKSKFEVTKQKFPEVSLILKRNSELKSEKVFIDSLRKTLEGHKDIAKIIKESSGKDVLVEEARYAGAVCPVCKSARGTTTIHENIVSFSCSNCGEKSTGDIKDFDYWWHHLPMLIPRIMIFGADLCLRGGDHFSSKHTDINPRLMNYFYPEAKYPATLVSPVLLSLDGRKMSKSKNNDRDVELEGLLKEARGWNSSVLPFSPLYDKSNY